VRYWTVSEAREYLPRVRELAECIRHAARLRAGEAGSHNGRRAPILDAQEALEELQAGDIIFRDAMTGLLDFHARGADGVVYFLCWRLDEDDIGFWHLPSEGFPGRKPLPRDPE
jgi:hypothetical protein